MTGPVVQQTSLSADDLRAKYEMMTRNLSIEQIARIEASGPLSDDELTRRRQQAFRKWLAASSGVILATAPGELSHYPV